MKKTIKLALVAALALGATSAFATNGSTMIATGTKASGMAGVGIGMGHGAESALVNPALITSVEGTEISFGGTFFMPDVENTNNIGAGDGTSSSDADLSVVPMVAVASKVTENLYIGVGMWGTAGMGVDYRDANGAQMDMVTNLQLMQFGVPVAYKVAGFSVAVTPLLQYGALDIHYKNPMNANATVGNGVAQDLAFGYNLGLAYEISGFTVGAIYKSQIDMEYKGQLSVAMQNFGLSEYTNDTLSTPAELGLGVSYAFGANTVALDYKQIKWEDAEGYKDFAWEDQNVISIGYEYAAKTWAARVGYNYASSPITEQSGSAGNLSTPSSGLINTFNLLGFPGIIETHYAIGGTYNFSEQTSFDVAYTFSPEAKETFKNFAGQDITTTHSQSALSVAVNFNF